MTTQHPVVGRYEVRAGLARGGTCRVYRAYDPEEKREVAIKILDKSYASHEGHRQRFEREAQAVAALQHPSIVKIYDFGGSQDAYLYLVMELISGPDLRRLCDERGPFPTPVVAAIGLKLAEALGYLHRNGVIHRDLKPENVFLDGRRIVLADFGIVKAINPDSPLGIAAASPQTAVIGTPGFMAPEQIEQKPLDERADWFAFGILLYVLLTDVMPFTGKNPYIIYKTIRDRKQVPLHQARSDIPESLSALVHECIEFDRKLRPTSATVVTTRLQKILHAMGVVDCEQVLARYAEDAGAFAVAPCGLDDAGSVVSDTRQEPRIVPAPAQDPAAVAPPAPPPQLAAPQSAGTDELAFASTLETDEVEPGDTEVDLDIDIDALLDPRRTRRVWPSATPWSPGDPPRDDELGVGIRAELERHLTEDTVAEPREGAHGALDAAADDELTTVSAQHAATPHPHDTVSPLAGTAPVPGAQPPSAGVDRLANFSDRTALVPWTPADFESGKLGRRLRWMGTAVVAVLIVAAVAAFIWLAPRGPGAALDARAGDPAARAAQHQAWVTVHYTEPATVLVNGKAVGTTPAFVPTLVPAGWVSLELISDRRGKLIRNIQLSPGDRATVQVEWSLRRMRVVRGP